MKKRSRSGNPDRTRIPQLYDRRLITSAEIQGTEGDDTLTAEEETDLAWFLNGGNDDLDGSDGADYAEGGAGDDSITMRDGNDIVLGGEGDDNIDTGTGFDLGYGGAGR